MQCRGLLVCRSTGRVLARRFHKFFNINERPEADVHTISIDENTQALEKLDGSLVSPLLVQGDVLLWASKSQILPRLCPAFPLLPPSQCPKGNPK